MLNRISGWLLFSQASYLVLFIVLTVIDLVTKHSLFHAFRALRSTFGLEHSLVRLSDYLYYPFVFTAPVNVALMVLFLRKLLRDSSGLTLASDFFSILNSFYVVGSGWVLFAVFSSLLKQ